MSKKRVALGRLESVEARKVWEAEATHFTPWLAEPESLRLLGQAIDIELELEAQEKDVGPFRADVLCKDTASGDWVLIENQLERTDHTHLGQLLTYAAGLKAVTIVWVATRFTEEHRAALDWLNEITDDRFNFFGLEVEVWRIGDSLPAPKFNVVSKPNDWTRSVAQAAARVELTESKRLQLAFWTSFAAFVEGSETTIRPTKPQPQHWMTMAIGRTGFSLSAVASLYDSQAESYGGHEVRVELVIDHSAAKRSFEELALQREAIEAELGVALEWYTRPGVRACRIYRRCPADLHDESSWEGLHGWLLEHLELFHGVFQPRVKALRVE